jgi:hypothetical protein
VRVGSESAKAAATPRRDTGENRNIRTGCVCLGLSVLLDGRHHVLRLLSGAVDALHDSVRHFVCLLYKLGLTARVLRPKLPL